MICPRHVKPAIGCRHCVPSISNTSLGQASYHVSRQRIFEFLASWTFEMFHQCKCRWISASSSQNFFQSSIGTVSELRVQFPEPAVNDSPRSSITTPQHDARQIIWTPGKRTRLCTKQSPETSPNMPLSWSKTVVCERGVVASLM